MSKHSKATEKDRPGRLDPSIASHGLQAHSPRPAPGWLELVQPPPPSHADEWADVRRPPLRFTAHLCRTIESRPFTEPRGMQVCMT